jgi:hypothetical protein
LRARRHGRGRVPDGTGPCRRTRLGWGYTIRDDQALSCWRCCCRKTTELSPAPNRQVGKLGSSARSDSRWSFAPSLNCASMTDDISTVSCVRHWKDSPDDYRMDSTGNSLVAESTRSKCKDKLTRAPRRRHRSCPWNRGTARPVGAEKVSRQRRDAFRSTSPPSIRLRTRAASVAPGPVTSTASTGAFVCPHSTRGGS